MQKKYDFEIGNFDLEKFGEKGASSHCVKPETSANVPRYLAPGYVFYISMVFRTMRRKYAPKARTVEKLLHSRLLKFVRYER